MSQESAKEGLTLKLLGPVAAAAGETLKGVWETVFGKIDLYNAKKSALHAKELNDFRTSLEQKVIDIPPEELQEPRLSILGPTLDASKYYFEEEPLRDMFASLAAASMDRRKERDLHPSYPEIIKQMSPLDAQNIKYFRSQRPVAEYYVKYLSDGHQITTLSNVFLENKNETDLFQQARSLTSLSRLGLIQIEYGGALLKDKFYTDLLTTDYFLRLSASLDPKKQIAGIVLGRAKPTPFGQAFISVCVS